MKGYRFTNGRLDRRPLSLEDIPNLSLPYELTYLENNLSFLLLGSGRAGNGAIGPNPLIDNFYCTSFHLYGESINEFMNGQMNAPFATSKKRIEALFDIAGNNIIFWYLLISGEYNALNVSGTWMFGWNFHFPFPVLIPSGQYMRLVMRNYVGVFDTNPVNFYTAVAGFYE